MSQQVLGIIAPHPPIMVPEVGRQDSELTAASIAAMQTAARVLEAFAPDTVVVMSPHSPAAADAFLIDTAPTTAGSLAQFGAPHQRFEYRTDVELAATIISALRESRIPVIDRADDRLRQAGRLDHGVMVPMRFLGQGGPFALVNLSLSWLSYEAHRHLGETVASAAERIGRRIAFVASGDCSHRLSHSAPAGYSPRGAVFDESVLAHVRDADFAGLMRLDPNLIEAAGECGLRSFVTLGGVIPDAETEVLAYEAPWGVGYLTALAGTPGLLGSLGRPRDASLHTQQPADKESEPVSLARQVIDTYVRERRVLDPGTPTGLLAEQAGAFVSLHRGGALRGCIGTISATAPTLAQEITHNAIQAATADPRFPPLTKDELEDLEISVDVLEPAEPCSAEDLDPLQYGVIVSCDWRRGLLLPNLEGVDTADEQVSIARSKGGIRPDEPVRLERFRVRRYH